MNALQSVIVTGAASGIGRACAFKFASSDYGVMLCDRDDSLLEKAVDDMRANGMECQAVRADVTSTRDLEHVAAQTKRAWGRIDVLIANAGSQEGGGLLDTQAEDWQRVIEVNLKGVARSCRAVLPAMQSQGCGSIVIVSSVNALVGSKAMAAYDMSKAGLLGLMRSIAVEFGGFGIRANAICPGNTITDHHVNKFAADGISVEDIRAAMSGYGALGRAAEPEEIANAIYFLASAEASFVTGHALVADGGFSAMAGR